MMIEVGKSYIFFPRNKYKGVVKVLDYRGEREWIIDYKGYFLAFTSELIPITPLMEALF
jgi:hypothetical protein